MAFSLIPRDEGFFDLFEEQAVLMTQTGDALAEMLVKFADPQKSAGDIKLLESKADTVTSNLYSALDRSFLTPLDPEDIHALAKAMDNVIDAIEDCAFRFSIYLHGEERPTPTAVKLGELIREASRRTGDAIMLLRNKRNGAEIMAAIREVASLETKGDHLFREVETALFANPVDAISLLKWNELYSRLEEVLDTCRDVGNHVTEIVLKSS